MGLRPQRPAERQRRPRGVTAGGFLLAARFIVIEVLTLSVVGASILLLARMISYPALNASCVRALHLGWRDTTTRIREANAQSGHFWIGRLRYASKACIPVRASTPVTRFPRRLIASLPHWPQLR
jgi:hypothetical protein